MNMDCRATDFAFWGLFWPREAPISAEVANPKERGTKMIMMTMLKVITIAAC